MSRRDLLALLAIAVFALSARSANVHAGAGNDRLKVVAGQQYFNLNSVRLAP